VVEVLGTKGRAMVNASRDMSEIIGKKSWKFAGPNNDMFQTEHNELFASIPKGTPIDNGDYIARMDVSGRRRGFFEI
jgi:myo-inositol 2-dehydrogenase / D-chiro-inositol 1-dehydrogenase